ncbi:MAG: DMT family transporter [Alphaproteobacteria bacterium]
MTALTRDAARPAIVAGVLMMLVGILMFSLNDVMGKWLVATYTVGQLLVIRSGAALLVLAPWVIRAGVPSMLGVERPGLQVARVVVSTLEVALFYWVVIYLPLADAMTYWLAGPIWVVIIAAIVLRERVTAPRWGAVFLGFVGVVIALSPTQNAFSWPVAAALLGSLLFAVMNVIARQLKATSDLALVFWQNVGALLMGLALIPWGWTTPSLLDLALLSLLGVVAMVAHMCVTRSLKLAPASVVTPYQYTLIIWAVLFGWLVFADVPTLSMLIGSGIIIVAGIVLFWLEQSSADTSVHPP